MKRGRCDEGRDLRPRSTFDQEPENQLQELRRYVEAREWAAVEYVDRGVSGATDRRPALDQVLRDARRRRFDVVVCCRLDRLGRNLKHLITLLEELRALGVAFVSLAEGIDGFAVDARVTVVVARRCFPELFGEDVAFGRQFVAQPAVVSVDELFIQGRQPTPFATNALARVEDEIAFVAASYRLAGQQGSCGYLRRR